MKVLVAIDDSDCSREVLHVVRKRRWPANCTFKVLTVVEPVTLFCSDDQTKEDPFQTICDAQMRAAGKLCDRARLILQAGIPDCNVESEIRKGDSKSEILACAQEWGADRIVIGAHGKHVCPHNMPGSVSRFVVRQAPCTVEVIRPFERKKELVKNA